MVDLKENKYVGYFFGIPIALLYGVFFTKLVNLMMGYEKIDKQCEGIKYPFAPRGSLFYTGASPKTDPRDQARYEKEKEEYDKCRDKRQMELEELKKRKFNVMMVIGFIGIIVGVILHKQSIAGGQLQVAGAGLAVGGVLTMVYYIFENWWRMNEKSRLIVSGALLISLIYGSYQLLY